MIKIKKKYILIMGFLLLFLVSCSEKERYPEKTFYGVWKTGDRFDTGSDGISIENTTLLNYKSDGAYTGKVTFGIFQNNRVVTEYIINSTGRWSIQNNEITMESTLRNSILTKSTPNTIIKEVIGAIKKVSSNIEKVNVYKIDWADEYKIIINIDGDRVIYKKIDKN